MDRRQLLVTAGTVATAGIAGCTDGDNGGPDAPFIADSDLGTDGGTIINVAVVNPTDEPFDLTVWARLFDDGGSELDQGSTDFDIEPNAEGEDAPTIPVVFEPDTYTNNDIEDWETALTSQDAESPF